MPIPAGSPRAFVAGYRPDLADLLTDVSVALDGWTAGAIDTQGTEWWLTSFEGWHGTADLRLFGADRPNDHGQFDAPSYFGSRVVTMQGTAIALDRPTAYTARDIASSLCMYPSQLYTLRVTEPGRPTRRANVRLNSAIKVSDVNDTAFDWQVQLKAPDPRRYDDTETVLTLAPPTDAVGGLTLPAAVPLTLATAGGTRSATTVTNAGTIATRPIVAFNGPLVDPQIANVTAGRSLSLNITLVAGDQLVADFDKRTLLLNGSASRSSALTAAAAWWELAPGGNDLAMTAGGGTGNATIRYRSAWL